MMQWIRVNNAYVYDDMVGACVAERFVKPMRGLEPDEARIAAALPDIHATLDVLTPALTGRRCLCGDAVTLADLFLAPILVCFRATPEGQTALPSRQPISD